MRGRLWVLNMLLSNMVNVFLITYVLANIEVLGSLGALLIMTASSCLTLLLSWAILGKERGLGEGEIGGTRWKTYLVLLSILVGVVGFVVNNSIVIILGFLLLIPVLLPSVLKALNVKV